MGNSKAEIITVKFIKDIVSVLSYIRDYFDGTRMSVTDEYNYEYSDCGSVYIMNETFEIQVENKGVYVLGLKNTMNCMPIIKFITANEMENMTLDEVCESIEMALKEKE